MLGNFGFLLILAVFLATNGARLPTQKKWWETASFYQIYPRSFKDSNGDGVGDLKGVMKQLPYLKEIGITATWLSPIFSSPMVDFGYDVANFTEIDSIFGTMEDLEALIEKAKLLDIKIILDFVPNHTSDECEWFIKSVANDPFYKDFFVWHPGKIVNGTLQPPTNWISAFRGSAWTWHPDRQQYYLHQFHAKQPDLNYRNPKVMETMGNILRFWLRKGVSGFRVDSLPFMVEVAPDETGNLPDEPLNPDVDDPLDAESLLHIYTKNQPESVELIYEFRAVLDEINAEEGGEDRILMIEGYAPIDVVMTYYGNSTVNGAQIPFNFEMITYLNNQSNAYDYSKIIHNWLDNMPKGRTANWVLGNHDNKRIGIRFGTDRIDMLNMLLLTLPGCSVTYYGEEIGMTDVWISWEDSIDPAACQSNPQEYERLSRDPERTPFQWNDETNAGFTEGKRTWLPVSDNYQTINVKNERGMPNSHLSIYKQLRNLRNERTMQYGDAEVKALSQNVLAIKRSYNDQPTYVILLNIFDGMEEVNLNEAFEGLSSTMKYHIVTDRSIQRKDDVTRTDSILLLPKEAIVLRTL